MSHCQQCMDGHAVGAIILAYSAARFAEVSFRSTQPGIFLHGIFFISLGFKIVVVSHDGVNRHFIGATGFTQAAGMTAVEFSWTPGIGRQLPGFHV